MINQLGWGKIPCDMACIVPMHVKPKFTLLYFGLPRSNCETALSQEWEGVLTWSKRDVSQSIGSWAHCSLDL